MVETSAQKQTASTTATNAPANVRVNTSVQYPSIAVHQSALPTESHSMRMTRLVAMTVRDMT